MIPMAAVLVAATALSMMGIFQEDAYINDVTARIQEDSGVHMVVVCASSGDLCAI